MQEPSHYRNHFVCDPVRAHSNTYSYIYRLTAYDCKSSEFLFLSFLCGDKSAEFVWLFCAREPSSLKHVLCLLALCNAAFWGVSCDDAATNSPICNKCWTPAGLKVLTYTHECPHSHRKLDYKHSIKSLSLTKCNRAWLRNSINTKAILYSSNQNLIQRQKNNL